MYQDRNTGAIDVLQFLLTALPDLQEEIPPNEDLEAMFSKAYGILQSMDRTHQEIEQIAQEIKNSSIELQAIANE